MKSFFDLAFWEFDGYLHSPLPDDRDVIVEQALAEIAVRSRADRDSLRAGVTLEDSEVFNAFAQRWAVRAVREGSLEYLRLGLLSLAMAGALDYRENLMVLSLVARSAEILDSSLGSVVESYADLLPEKALLRFRDFASWPDADRNIRAMGFAESGVGEDFTYLRVSPRS